MVCVTKPLIKKRKPLTEPPVFGANANTYYGKPIPLTGGVRAVSGVLLWAAPFKVYKNADGTKRRYATFMVGFGYPLAPNSELADVDMLRLWINQRAVMDRRSTQGFAQGKFKYRFYAGNERQLPDHVLERDRSMAKAERPAYRGMIYLVIEDLDMNFYGWEVIPSDIRAELIDRSVDNSTYDRWRRLGAMNNLEDNGGFKGIYVDWENGLAYQPGTTDADAQIGCLHCYDLITKREIYCVELELPEEVLTTPHGNYPSVQTYPMSVIMAFTVIPRAGVIVGHMGASTNAAPVGVWDLLSGKCVATYGQHSSSLTIDWDNPGPSILGSEVYSMQVRPLKNESYHKICSEFPIYYAIVTNGPYMHITAIKPYLGYWTGPGYTSPNDWDKGGSKFISVLELTANVNHICLLKHENETSFTQYTEPTLTNAVKDYRFYTTIPFVVSKGRYLDLFVMDAYAQVADWRAGFDTSDGTPYNAYIEHHENYIDLGADISCNYIVREKDGEFVCICQDNSVSGFGKPLKLVKIKLLGDNWKIASVGKPKVAIPYEIIYETTTEELYSTLSGNLTSAKGKVHNVSQGTFMFSLGTGFALINLASGSIRRIIDVAPVRYPSDVSGAPARAIYWNSTTRVVFNSLSQSFIGPFGNTSIDPAPGELYLGRSDGSVIDLSTAIRWMALKAGYVEDDLYIENLSISVYGAIVDQRVGFVEVLEQLRQAFGFQYYESENKLKVVRKARLGETITPDFTADQSIDFAPIDGDDDSRDLITTRGAVSSLPTQIDLKFVDRDNDYTVSSITAKRTVFPVQTNKGNTNVSQLSIPIVMSSKTAFNYLNRMLATEWNSQIGYEGRLPIDYVGMEPSDIIELTYGGATYTIQVNEATWNADNSVSWNGLALEVEGEIDLPDDLIYGVTPTTSVKMVTLAKPILIETSFLSSDDAAAYLQGGGSIPIAIGVVATSATFTDAEVFTGAVGSDLIGVGIAANQTVIGFAYTVLSATETPFDEDAEGTFEFLVTSGSDLEEITGTTDDDFYAGTYQLIVGSPGRWEIIYYRNRSIDDDGVITVTGLLRGRRGTEEYCDNHEIGDTVIIIDQSSSLFSVDTVEAELGTNRAIAAVGDGLDPFLAAVEFFVPTGEVLKPFAPNDFRIDDGVIGTDDLLLKWQRRDKISSTVFGDGEPVIPMSEETELYHILVTPVNDALPTRLITAITSEEYTYTVSELSTDGSGEGVTLTVYQVNAIVGIGHGTDLLIEV